MEDTLLELTRRAVRCLVDSPDDVEVYVEDDGDDGIRLLISTAPGELGQVIGKQGRNLEALRTIVQSCAGKWHSRGEVELLEPDDRIKDAPPAIGQRGPRRVTAMERRPSSLTGR